MKIIGEDIEITDTEEKNESNDLIDSKLIKKQLINKTVIIVSIAVIVVVSSSIAGVMIAKSHNEKLLAKHYESVENNANEIPEEAVNEENKPLPTPVYGENAKNRMANIYEPVNEEKIAYLTFDDGPSSAITPQILQILKEEEVKATFFILGYRVELLPELVKQAYEEGHYIANHGYTHSYSEIYKSLDTIFGEYVDCENAVRNALGIDDYRMYLFRYPGGSAGGRYSDVKNESKNVLNSYGVTYTNWNCMTGDAEGKNTVEEQLEELKATMEGDDTIIVLMHDASDKQVTADALPEVIRYLKEQGYTFKNFYEIF